MTIVPPRSSGVVVIVLPSASVLVETARAPPLELPLLELLEDDMLTDELDDPDDDALAALRPGDVLARVDPSFCWTERSSLPSGRIRVTVH